MKYIKKYEAFKNENSEPVNEEFLGKLIGGIKNLIKKGQERINKTKGGKEIDVIYQKYLNMITVVISSYKYGHLAAHCIESVLCQTKKADKILFVDDAKKLLVSSVTALISQNPSFIPIISSFLI